MYGRRTGRGWVLVEEWALRSRRPGQYYQRRASCAGIRRHPNQRNRREITQVQIGYRPKKDTLVYPLGLLLIFDMIGAVGIGQHARDIKILLMFGQLASKPGVTRLEREKFHRLRFRSIVIPGFQLRAAQQVAEHRHRRDGQQKKPPNGAHDKDYLYGSTCANLNSFGLQSTHRTTSAFTVKSAVDCK